MNKTIYDNWSGHIVKLSWIPISEIPMVDKVTSVHGVCFFRGQALLVNINGRGFNFPGGHVEIGESPEEAFHREAYEEAYIKGDITQVGIIEVNHEENPLFNPLGKYPIIGYQVFYRMEIMECLPFKGEHESSKRIFIEPEQVPQLINDHELSIMALNEAIAVGKSVRK
jgi:ADP-ribose pyrophosphatase YjhB (NUDIX family)